MHNYIHLAFFVVTTLVLFFTLLLGLPLRLFSASLWVTWVNFCKGLFGKLLVNLLQHCSPATARIYTETPHIPVGENEYGRKKLVDLLLSPQALVTMNHQIYSDWVYLWWLLYAANLQSSPTIVLKKSLKNVPVFGWAMQLFKFLFLSRKWEEDQKEIHQATTRLAAQKDQPMWLVLFPEGTVYNQQTYERSASFYERTHHRSLPLTDTLYPRSKGLQAILQGFDNEIKILYDFTFVYTPEPPKGHQDVESFYNLKRTFVEGKGPQSVRIYIRRIPVASIPFRESSEAFMSWLAQFWQEKDLIYRKLRDGELEEQFRAEGSMRLRSIFEIFECFAVVMTLVLLVRIFLLLR